MGRLTGRAILEKAIARADNLSGVDPVEVAAPPLIKRFSVHARSETLFLDSMVGCEQTFLFVLMDEVAIRLLGY